MEQVYLQTYSLGKAMEEAFLTSLEKVAQIGYSGVEFAGAQRLILFGTKKFLFVAGEKEIVSLSLDKNCSYCE